MLRMINRPLRLKEAVRSSDSTLTLHPTSFDVFNRLSTGDTVFLDIEFNGAVETLLYAHTGPVPVSGVVSVLRGQDDTAAVSWPNCAHLRQSTSELATIMFIKQVTA